MTVVSGCPGRRVVVLAHRVVELLLHAGDVGVRRLHDQPRPGSELRVRADVAVHDDHVLAGDVGVLLGGDPVILLAGDRLLGGIGRVIDDEGRPGASRVDSRLDHHVAELGDLAVRHLLGQLAEPLRGRIPLHRRGPHLIHHGCSSSWAPAQHAAGCRSHLAARTGANAYPRHGISGSVPRPGPGSIAGPAVRHDSRRFDRVRKRWQPK